MKKFMQFGLIVLVSLTLLGFVTPARIAHASSDQNTVSTASKLRLKIKSITSPVKPGGEATLIAETAPNAVCTISIYYYSGDTEGYFLKSKKANQRGIVSWTWIVRKSALPKAYKVVVTAKNTTGKVIKTTTMVVQ